VSKNPEEVATEARKCMKYKPRVRKISTKKKKLKRFYEDETLYMDIFTLKEKPVSDALLEQLAARLVEWVLGAEENERLVFEDFLRSVGRTDKSFALFMKRSSKLKAAHRFALMCLGANRERGMLLQQLNGSGVVVSMPLYSERWKELLEWKASLNNKEESKPTTINVVIPDLVKKEEINEPNTKK